MLFRSAQRVERLKLIVQNRRFLLLAAKGQSPNLASQTVIVHQLETGIDILCGKIPMDRSKPLIQKISVLRSWNARTPN